MGRWAAMLVLMLAAGEILAQTGSRHLFILSGQSNMARMNPDLTFTPYLQGVLGSDQVVVIKDAQGAQPIRRWIDAETAQPGPLYLRLLQKVRDRVGELKPDDSVTFVWMQGERDAREGLGLEYENNLQILLARLRKDLRRNDMVVVIGRISDHGLAGPRSDDWRAVRAAQERVAESSMLAAWIDTDDLNDGTGPEGTQLENDLHYTDGGYRELGLRFANQAIRLHREANPPAQEKANPVVQN
ncbi:sialate O-acetylesterase [Microbulbifer guangxiensis]|uniref:sialate O-acetylesterase n=1 Tax=Microbulbifer guangxiensis TaxID=2904249 RepID=UPI001F3C0D6E|nr:sialate O-acetylesterase [Microbulbifer guangxiensis]